MSKQTWYCSDPTCDICKLRREAEIKMEEMTAYECKQARIADREQTFNNRILLLILSIFALGFGSATYGCHRGTSLKHAMAQIGYYDAGHGDLYYKWVPRETVVRYKEVAHDHVDDLH